MDDSDRIHLLRIGWRLDALDEWRRETESRLGGIEQQVSELVKADQIAEAIARRMEANKELHLSVAQRYWAIGFGVVASLGSIGGIVALILQFTGG